MSRAEELASEFEHAYTEFADFASGLSTEEWTKVAANSPVFKMGQDERRPVGVVAHHVAVWLPRMAETIRHMAAGQPLPPMQHHEIEQSNAAHAAANPEPSQPRTVGMIRENGSRAASLLRGLDDEGLARTARSLIGPMTTEDFIKRVLIGHVYWHLGSVRATVVTAPNPQPDAGSAAISR
jgi:hypothetical protein